MSEPMEIDNNNVDQHSDQQQEIQDSTSTSNSLEPKSQKDGKPLREAKELVSKLKTAAGSNEYTDNLKKALASKSFIYKEGGDVTEWTDKIIKGMKGGPLNPMFYWTAKKILTVSQADQLTPAGLNKDYLKLFIPEGAVPYDETTDDLVVKTGEILHTVLAELGFTTLWNSLEGVEDEDTEIKAYDDELMTMGFSGKIPYSAHRFSIKLFLVKKFIKRDFYSEVPKQLKNFSEALTRNTLVDDWTGKTKIITVQELRKSALNYNNNMLEKYKDVQNTIWYWNWAMDFATRLEPNVAKKFVNVMMKEFNRMGNDKEFNLDIFEEFFNEARSRGEIKLIAGATKTPNLLTIVDDWKNKRPDKKGTSESLPNKRPFSGQNSDTKRSKYSPKLPQFKELLPRDGREFLFPLAKTKAYSLYLSILKEIKHNDKMINCPTCGMVHLPGDHYFVDGKLVKPDEELRGPMRKMARFIDNHQAKRQNQNRFLKQS